MKISELISELTNIMNENGDINVFTSGEFGIEKMDKYSFSIHIDLDPYYKIYDQKYLVFCC